GLPVVSTIAGAIPHTVPAGTGLLVPPDDVAALAQALRRLISDRAERQRLARNARAAAAQLPTWQDSARLFAGAIKTVVRRAGPRNQTCSVSARRSRLNEPYRSSGRDGRYSLHLPVTS